MGAGVGRHETEYVTWSRHVTVKRENGMFGKNIFAGVFLAALAAAPAEASFFFEGDAVPARVEASPRQDHDDVRAERLCSPPHRHNVRRARSRHRAPSCQVPK